MLLKSWFCVCLFFYLFSGVAHGQKYVRIGPELKEHIFSLKDVDYLEDPDRKIVFRDLQQHAGQYHFQDSADYYPKNYHRQSIYWYRIRLNFTAQMKHTAGLIEFFDQTIDALDAYIPDSAGKYHEYISGADLHFGHRLYGHKNFEFPVNSLKKGSYTFYFKVHSSNLVNIIIVYRTLSYFITYALSEYFMFGLFYGMILIFSFYNLLMYIAVKRIQYLYYVLYILSAALFQMSSDGIGFQFLWPDLPWLNDYAFGVALYLLGSLSLIFTKEFLQLKLKAPLQYRMINDVLLLRTCYFLYCLFFNKGLFMFKFIEAIPLSVAFYTGLVVWKNGYKAARFFVLGYAVLFAGFMVKTLYALGFTNLFPRLVSNYSISFCFILEMLFLSFSISDQIRLLRKEKDQATEETLKQLSLNEQLNDSINGRLAEEVKQRTAEIREQASVIQRQHDQLSLKNFKLETLAADITRMNVLLERDNSQLKTNIARHIEARVNSRELTFEEFSAKYPDQESCFKYLSELKWPNGYQCTRCQQTSYCSGRTPYSRRCTKCTYEETVLHNTFFYNCRIPINKAFYLVYLMYITKGSISSYELSEKLGIRQSTCWSYARRLKKVLEKQPVNKKIEPLDWSLLIAEVK